MTHQIRPTVIFDFDGTIADTMQFVKSVADEILPGLGIRSLTEQDIKKLRGMSIPQGLRYMKIPVYKLPQIVLQGRNKLTQHVDELNLCDGMGQAVRALKKDNFRLGIITSNSTDTVERFLLRHDLRDAFEFVDGGVGLFTKSRKLKQTMKKHAINTKHCIYVGDEVRDIDAANATKVDSVAVTWGVNTEKKLLSSKPTHVVKTANKLVEVAQTYRPS